MDYKVWDRFTIEKGTIDDVIEVYAMPGVFGLRLSGNRVVQLASQYPAGQTALLALAFTRGRVVLKPVDEDSPPDGGPGRAA